MHASKTSLKNLFKRNALLLFVLGINLFASLYLLKTAGIIPIKALEQNVDIHAKNITDLCINKENWRSCYGEAYRELVKEIGFENSLKTLPLIQVQDPKTRDCHILAHYSTAAAIEQNPKIWRDILKNVNLSDCNYGYVHGTLEALSHHDPSFAINTATIPNICHQIDQIKQGQGAEQGCAHIMGHILLSLQCEIGVEPGLKETINQCAELSQNLQPECYAGAFMESFTRDNLAAECQMDRIPTNEETVANQERICLSYEGEAAKGCWQEISHMYNSLHPNDPMAIYNRCTKAQEEDSTLKCYQHAVGSLVHKEEYTSSYFLSICEPLKNTKEAYLRCTGTAVGTLMTASIKFLDRALDFCLSYPQDIQPACFNSLIQGIKRKTDKESSRKEACMRLPTKYYNSCIY